MRAISVEGGKDYTLSIADVDDVSCGEHEVLIEVKACGVNRADIYQAQGTYPPPEGTSAILGLEVSGIITEIGSKVKTHAVGDAVCALLSGGGYAERVAVPEWRALPIPQGCDFVQAACLPEAMFTVYHTILELGKLSPNKNILIHGGTSGIGTCALQVAKIFGRHVFTTVGNGSKKDFFADDPKVTAINYREQDFVEEVLSVCPDGIDIVLDMVGGSYFQRNMKVLKKYGKIISIAFIEGAKQEVNFAPLLMKNLTWTGATLRSKNEGEIYDLAQSVFSTLWSLVESGDITPVIDSVFALEDAQLAHERMLSSEHIGKIVLTP